MACALSPHLSPHLFPHALAAGCCHEIVWLGQLACLLSLHVFSHTLAGRKLSRDFLAWSVACPLICSHLSPHLLRLPGLDAVTRWSGSVSSLVSICPRACWAGCSHKMVWLGRLFVLSFAVTRWSGSVSSLVSICPRTCFLKRLLGRMQSQDGLARSVVCPLICCDKMVWLGQLACFHLSPHVFSNALAGQDAVTRWSGSVGCLSSHLL